MKYNELMTQLETNRVLFRNRFAKSIKDDMTRQLTKSGALFLPITVNVNVDKMFWVQENIPLVKSTLRSLGYNNTRVELKKYEADYREMNSYDQHFFVITINEN